MTRRRLGWRELGSLRVPATAGLAGAAAAGLVAAVLAGAQGLAFFGQSEDDAYRSWRWLPLFWAGAAGVALAGLGSLLLLLPVRRRGAGAIAGLAVAGVVVALAGGAADVHRRSHPQAHERATMLALQPGPGVAGDRVTQGSEPTDVLSGPGGLAALLVAAPADLGPPTGVRSWAYATGDGGAACAQLRGSFAAWADRGTVRTFGPEPDQPCFLRGSRDGWPVYGFVVVAGGRSYGVAETSPPTVVY